MANIECKIIHRSPNACGNIHLFNFCPHKNYADEVVKRCEFYFAEIYGSTRRIFFFRRIFFPFFVGIHFIFFFFLFAANICKFLIGIAQNIFRFILLINETQKIYIK